ncbi:MAG: DNA polymerase III subunit beta [Patescibacteria group bacterium]|nr:DNA polymerase III subunit beta [Patescibacteria group bacterium]
MKISCLEENLAKGLSTVSRLVATRGTLEILSHILIRAEKGRLLLSATNLEIGINYKVGAKIEEEGSITVPARLFSELINELPEGKLDLKTENNTIYVKSGDYESHIKGLPADEFPLIPKIKEKKSFQATTSDLKSAINLVSFASALDETRPVLSGVYTRLDKNKLVMAATDSYRLAEKEISVNGGDKKIEVIIPTRSLAELTRVIGDTDENVDVYLDENQVMFETDDFEFTSRLIEGKFPDYKQIIPGGSETKAICESTEFVKVIKVAALFSGESVGSVNLEIKSKGKISATSSSSQFGDSTAACEAEVEGKDTEIVFNSRYILDVLSNLPSGKISLEVNGKLSPGVLKKEGDKSYLYVIMPLRA